MLKIKQYKETKNHGTLAHSQSLPSLLPERKELLSPYGPYLSPLLSRSTTEKFFEHDSDSDNESNNLTHSWSFPSLRVDKEIVKDFNDTDSDSDTDIESPPPRKLNCRPILSDLFSGAERKKQEVIEISNGNAVSDLKRSR